MDENNLLVITNIFPNEDGSYYQGVFVKEQIKFLKDYFDNVYVISPWPYGYKMFLKNYSYENVYVYYPRFIHFPIGYFRRRLGENYYKAILKVIKRENLKFKIVHAHFTWPSGYSSVKISKKFKVPIIITVHENQEWFLREYKSNNRKIYWSWRNADALIRVNKKDAILLKQFNQNVYSIPNGFSSDRLVTFPKEKARKELGIPTDLKIIFSLGNLIERKGFQYLIEAMKIIIKQRNDILCFIGGDGPLKKKLQKQIRKLNLQEHVKLLGPIPDDKLALWMNAADLFVLPSLSESFGVVQIEAMACGKPVVTTRNGGSEEIITSEDYGLLCEPANPQDLAEKILTALNKEWNREKIRKYAEQFDWKNIAKQIFKVYEDILSKY